MGFRAGSVEPDESFSPPLVRDNPEFGNKSPYTTGQLVNPLEWELSNSSADSHDSTSTSSSSDEPGTDMNHDNCERVLEQWRSIRLADKNRPKKKKVVCLELDLEKKLTGQNRSIPTMECIPPHLGGITPSFSRLSGRVSPARLLTKILPSQSRQSGQLHPMTVRPKG